jgi:L-methionine (R)-S-oxide reductase
VRIGGGHASIVAMATSTLERWLSGYLEDHGAVAGTVHVREGDALRLCAARNIPQKVIEAVELVPKGKGMAGLALERNDVVSTCNLKSDDTGDVRPGAKAVDANAAVAIPVHDASGNVRGVVGIAFMGERDISPEEMARLKKRAEEIPL